MVYDSALQEFFFSNPGMNEVEAYSTVDGHRVGAVTVPGPLGLSLSPDGSELAVGASTPHLYFVNPATLHVTGEVEVPASVLNPETGLEPVLPFLMASGPMLIETAYLDSGEGTLLSYDPATGVFAQMNPPGATAGFGVCCSPPARSLDGNYLAVPTLGQTALELAVYSAQTQSYIGSTPGQYNISGVAASPDGSQFVTVGTPSYGSGGNYITFWSRSLQQEAQYAPTNPNDINFVYSRDGNSLYVNEVSDVLALDTQTGLPAGYQGLSMPFTQPPTLFDTDESDRVYGTTDLGAFVVSVAQLQPTAPVMPGFEEDTLGESIGGPNEGPLSGGTEVQFAPVPGGAGSADGISSTMEAYFGSVPATKDVIGTAGGNFITATAPAASTNGPVTVLLTDANNNAVLLPGAYSYGPHAHWIDPSAMSSTQGAVSTLFADGIMSLPGEPPGGANLPDVTIGGVLATTRPLNSVGTDTWQEVQVDVLAGTPGWADLKMSLSDGTSETTKNMVQFLAQDMTLTSPAYTAAVYDASRDRFYLTGADNTVGVFDPETQSLLQPMTSSSISSGAVLGSLALTPDDSELLVSDPADHSVVVFDLTTGTSSAVNVLVPSDGAMTISAPMPVVTLSGDRALVLLTPWSTNEVREIDLADMTVQVRTDVQEADSSYVPPSTMASSADGTVALLGGETPGSPTTYFAWKYDAASDTFTAPMNLSYYAQGDRVAVNADGTVLGIGAFTLDQNLMPLVPFQFVGMSTLLTGSGGLRYSAEGEVEIADTHNGRSLLTLSVPSGTTAFAVDPDGQQILVCAGTSLYYYQLAVVPLAVASVSPAEAAPGASVTVSGDGFVAGTTATIAGQSASCSMVNDQTLQCVVPSVNSGLAPMTLSNPDGQTYSLEAAVTVE